MWAFCLHIWLEIPIFIQLYFALSMHLNFKFDPQVQTSRLNLQHSRLDLNVTLSHLKHVIHAEGDLSPTLCSITYINNYSLLYSLSKTEHTPHSHHFHTCSTLEHSWGWKVFELMNVFCGKLCPIPVS